MVTITEDYVIFEVAKLLKEKGFNEPCHATYDTAVTGGNRFSEYEVLNYFPYGMKNTDDNYGMVISAPTLQMAMKYLRKKYKVCIVSTPVVTDDDGDGGCLWNYVISRKLKPLYESESLYESPEIALNNAIKYFLENLI